MCMCVLCDNIMINRCLSSCFLFSCFSTLNCTKPHEHQIQSYVFEEHRAPFPLIYYPISKIEKPWPKETHSCASVRTDGKLADELRRLRDFGLDMFAGWIQEAKQFFSSVLTIRTSVAKRTPCACATFFSPSCILCESNGIYIQSICGWFVKEHFFQTDYEWILR